MTACRVPGGHGFALVAMPARGQQLQLDVSCVSEKLYSLQPAHLLSTWGKYVTTASSHEG